MQFIIKAEKRVEQGTGASRRLRRAGKAVGIIYGGDKAPVQITLDHNDLFHAMRKEAFHASVLTIDVDGTKETAVLRDTQWHAYKQQILHIDFQRVDATHKMHTKVPLHFVNADIAPGVKLEGGLVSHAITELDVECLPGDLPAFIEVDLKALVAGASIHVSELTYPAGVKPTLAGETVVASIVKGKGATEAAEGEAQA
ncbi:50S ribosomal protein L25/general stress protein Ctc [Niveibacterium umoris]|uniref:Large ribosomal subunit protein bL25 n=1 Tax=Niveibacterium umoris TaxID=1193620 RepID=A0A840BIE5_9RHOO|nr:50S ribosomal protein L25/general stress protein Ctc [Niveibacterium umoris]MBB4012995.1 large subunit ribosomal protein L25 [Niveibacterium umoris]